MESNVLKSKKELYEINLIKLRLRERYDVLDMVLLQALAVELISNGIGIDKFNSFYNKKNGFDFDEIVYYLLDIILFEKEDRSFRRRDKVVDFSVRKRKILLKRNFYRK